MGSNILKRLEGEMTAQEKFWNWFVQHYSNQQQILGEDTMTAGFVSPSHLQLLLKPIRPGDPLLI